MPRGLPTEVKNLIDLMDEKEDTQAGRVIPDGPLKGDMIICLYRSAFDVDRSIVLKLFVAVTAGYIIQQTFGGIIVDDHGVKVDPGNNVFRSELLAPALKEAFKKAYELEGGALSLITAPPISAVLQFAQGVFERSYNYARAGNLLAKNVRETARSASSLNAPVKKILEGFDTSLDEILQLIAAAESQGSGLREAIAKTPVLASFGKIWDEISKTGKDNLQKSFAAVRQFSGWLTDVQSGILGSYGSVVDKAWAPLEGATGVLARLTERANTTFSHLSSSVQKANKANQESEDYVNRGLQKPQSKNQKNPAIGQALLPVAAAAGLRYTKYSLKNDYDLYYFNCDQLDDDEEFYSGDIRSILKELSQKKITRRQFFGLGLGLGATVTTSALLALMEMRAPKAFSVGPGEFTILGHTLSLRDLPVVREKNLYQKAFNMRGEALQEIVSDTRKIAVQALRDISGEVVTLSQNLSTAISNAESMATQTEKILAPINEKLIWMDGALASVLKLIESAEEAAGKKLGFLPSVNELKNAAARLKNPALDQFISTWEQIVTKSKEFLKQATQKINQLETTLTQGEAAILNKIGKNVSQVALEPWKKLATFIQDAAQKTEGHISNLETTLKQMEAVHQQALDTINKASPQPAKTTRQPQDNVVSFDGLELDKLALAA